ncbi:MAG: Diacylglycerol kinase [Holosporales bacterium]
MLKKIYLSTQYSLCGLISCFKREQSFRLEIFLLFLTIFLTYVLNFLFWQALILCLCVVFIMIIELLNSAIEKLADLITVEKNDHIAYAKDVGSAAVFLMHLIYFFLFAYFKF